MSKSLGNTIVPETVVKQYGADILRLWGLWVAQVDYTNDQRIGPEILKGTADNYRRLRNTMRFMLGSLADFTEADRIEAAEMPELERWVLHRVAELDQVVRKGYAAFDFQGVFSAVFTFATVELSAFYFDVRKDVLYCDGDTNRRKAARTVLDILFHKLTKWLAPVLVFTMEEAKVIGASLEAAPTVYVSADEAAILETVAFDDLCITSGIHVSTDAAPEAAFRIDDVADVAVVFAKADGDKCQRCWKILPDVGSHSHAGVCGRCNDALG